MKQNRHSRAKLNIEDVRAILRELQQHGDVKEIAERWRVSPQTIYHISSRHTWYWVKIEAK